MLNQSYLSSLSNLYWDKDGYVYAILKKGGKPELVDYVSRK